MRKGLLVQPGVKKAAKGYAMAVGVVAVHVSWAAGVFLI